MNEHGKSSSIWRREANLDLEGALIQFMIKWAEEIMRIELIVYVKFSRIKISDSKTMHEPANGLVYAIYYPVLAAAGIPANIIAIVILSRGKCGLSKCITHYLVGMAAADLLVVITGVILNRIVGIYLPASYMSLTPICSLKIVLIYATRDISVWLTVAFTFDRFVAICCDKLKTRYCRQKVAAAVVGMIFTLGGLQNIPWYFKFEPMQIINGMPWYCHTKPNFYTAPLWIIFSAFKCIATPFLPFFLIVLLNVLTVRFIIVASRGRKALRRHNHPADHKDPEMENRKRSIVLLFAISGSFVLLWMTFIIHFLYYRITNTLTYSGYDDPVFILQEVGYMLLLLSCCTNTCIYAATQQKFREELKKSLKYPLTRIARFLK
ncbi:probable G-protein coupled receptor 139 [Pristis pectinata]|uniref:probable G-protein coupled receptor 139 n=1 Tax=Pristis pectinata TaxID=685728 RepID=UPI00223D8030|nr:probable G-protein coupled receptor 139 [Pristis pectinata]